MEGQTRLIDRIRSFSPSREKWISKPTEAIPDRVSVLFKTGQTGLLDMKDRRAVHWARMIDELARTNQPVCVEIDQESSVITCMHIALLHACNNDYSELENGLF